VIAVKRIAYYVLAIPPAAREKQRDIIANFTEVVYCGAIFT
jgi:hypothetical protein